jgi:ligand-binding sensor domain-containing protein
MDYDATDPRWMDATSSLAFCDDGTLWIASYLHGLARRAPDGSISYLGLPPGHGDGASAVACDPTDGSIWVGFEWGGFGRWNGSSWWTIDAESPPSFAAHAPARAIQVDRWASPRVVWFALAQSKNGPGGLVSYAGR